MQKRKNNGRYTASDVAEIILFIIIIACLIGDIAVSIWLVSHVKGYWMMGSNGGYSIFELKYLWKKAPKAMTAQTVLSIGAIGSSIIEKLILQNRY